jgi:hypothetical protein
MTKPAISLVDRIFAHFAGSRHEQGVAPALITGDSR